MNVSKKMLMLKDRVKRDAEDFLSIHRPEESVLLLDSTGPSITRQYMLLHVLGLERLLKFKQVHAFSGASYALFGYLSLAAGSARISIDHLVSTEAEDDFRKHHHPSRASAMRSLVRLFTGRSAFMSPQPVIRTLEYIFGEYVDRRFDTFPDQFHIHLAVSGKSIPLVLSNGNTCAKELRELRQRPIKEIIAMAVNVPRVYGGIQAGFECADPVYTSGYREALRAITGQGFPTLVSTPWRSGTKGSIRFVNCYPQGNATWQMFVDFTRLVSGMRNTTWSRDIYAAFKYDGTSDFRSSDRSAVSERRRHSRASRT